MRLVHSLWSKPMLTASESERKTKEAVVLWCYASSVAFAKLHKQHIILFADDYAKELLSFLPYDEILPLAIKEDTPSTFWAAGKFAAYSQMQKGDIHIDGDVFLQTAGLISILEDATQKDYDVFVQCVEDDTNCYAGAYDKVCSILNKHNITYQNKQFPKFEAAYNTGLIGFGNMALRDKYVLLYFDSIDQIKNNQKLIEDLNVASSAPDIVLEQQTLFHLSQNKNTFSLLGRGLHSMMYSRMIGYQHLLGDAKTTCMHKIAAQLSSINKEIFSLTVDKANLILNRKL